MSSLAIEILIVVLLIIANGLLAMSEIAVVSSRKARLQQLANKGNNKAKAALELANSPTQFLSTVQVGISLIGILAGAFGGATLAQSASRFLKSIPLIAPYSDLFGLVSVVLLITYFQLIVGELVPKRLAMNSPENIAASIAIPMRMLAQATSPVVHLLSSSTELMLRLLGVTPSSDPEVTEEEIKVLLQQGTEAGTFEEAEQDMVERVFRLGDRRVGSLMTPRPDIVWLDVEDSLEENRQLIVESGHSRFPVCQGDLDTMLGVIHVNNLLTRMLAGQPIDLVASVQPPLFIPESTRALKILESFKQSGTHIGLVVDEYGVIQGLVTLDDILQAIIGDMPSINEEEAQAIQREDGSWLLDGMMPVDDFKEVLEIEEIPGEERGSYHTLAGFVVMHLGRIPVAADYFEWQRFRFEVMDMDGNRVDKVLVSVLPKQATTPSPFASTGDSNE
ncbi:MAG: hemolysin family protein [Leptolyngbyaceae cyanobacterium bins.59]|nr:hemolysin family protein [Leptolyngbyaceae cyanobacterium bins.59]